MGANNIVVLGLLAVSLSVGCATDEDYYEGEIVPTRPVTKPSLDPTQPAELTGSDAPTDIPGINETKIPGAQVGRDHFDGRIIWAEEVSDMDAATLVHHLDARTGVDSVDILDVDGNLIRVETRYSQTRPFVNGANGAL